MPTPEHIRLGYATYEEYLKSPHWERFRRSYYASGRPSKCSVCGDRLVQLHHVTYRRLGRERFDDVVPLCRVHHQQVHNELANSGLDVSATHQVIRELVLKMVRKKISDPDSEGFLTTEWRWQKMVADCQSLHANLSAGHPLRKKPVPWKSGWPIERKIKAAASHIAELRIAINEEWALRQSPRQEPRRAQEPTPIHQGKKVKKPKSKSSASIQKIAGASLSRENPGKVIMTHAIIELARSRNGGWSKKQLELVGVDWPLANGWKKSLIGQEITASIVHKFISMRDRHLPPPPKKGSPTARFPDTQPTFPRKTPFAAQSSDIR